MAAQAKITANTRDAQQKVQKLRKEVERLDKEAKKPKKVNVQGKSVLGKIGGAVAGGTSALAVAGGNIMSQIIQGMMRYIPAVTRLGAGLLGLNELEKAVTKITPKIRNLVDVIETFGNPSEEALNRADKIDALDDERRSHNSKSLAEEYAYSKAFSNVAGVNGTQIVDKLQNALDMVKSNNISEVERASKMLEGFGITYEDVLNKSTWEIFAKMLSAYNIAGADGKNELAPAMLQIVGTRQMAGIRKIAGSNDFEDQVKDYTKEFNEKILNQDKILEEAAKSEITRAKAEIQNMAIPEQGLHYINDEANNQLSMAQLKTGMIGDTKQAGEALSGLVDEIKADFQPALDELKDYSIKDYFMNMLGFGNGEKGSNNVAHANINVGAADIQTGGILTLHHLDPNTPLPVNYAANGTLAPIRDVVTHGTSTLSRPEITAPPVASATEIIGNTTDTLKTSLEELTKSIRDNTSSTKHAADVFTNFTVGTNGVNGTVFQ